MDERLEALEARRTRLCQALEALGDFRRGTISVNYRKCGAHLRARQGGARRPRPPVSREHHDWGEDSRPESAGGVYEGTGRKRIVTA